MNLPQLHLRDLFWLVLVCGLGCAWWMEHRRRAADAEVMRNLHEMTRTLLERIEQVEGFAAQDAVVRDYSGYLIEVIEEPLKDKQTDSP